MKLDQFPLGQSRADPDYYIVMAMHQNTQFIYTAMATQHIVLYIKVLAKQEHVFQQNKVLYGIVVYPTAAALQKRSEEYE